MIGIVIINFLRPDATIKCINSLLEQEPDIHVYLGDQDDNSKLEGYYDITNVHYTKLPHDCGIGYARNTLIDQMLQDGCEYFMWADNDFVFDNTFKLEDALTILKTNKKIGIVGGSLKKNNKMCHYERFMYYDRKRGILTYVPIDLSYPEPHKINGVKYYDCDITFNFAIAKKAVWEDKRVRWYEPIKVKFEHSVVGKTPILCKDKTHTFVSTIEDLVPKSIRHKHTNNYRRKNLEVWTEFGWEKVEYIYQHKVVEKPMSRILTRNGYVDLTSDHSLVIQGNEVKPTEITKNDVIEQHKFPQLSGDVSTHELWAWFLGFFLAEGHYHSKSRKLEISNQNLNDLDKCKKALELFGFKSKFWNTKERKDRCKFFVFENNKALDELFSQFYTSQGEKVIPKFVFNWNKESRNNFFNGFIDGDGTAYTEDKIQFSQKSQITVQGLLFLTRDIYPYYTLYNAKNKYGKWFIVQMYKMNKTKQHWKKLLLPKNIIKSKEEYTFTGYVYDLAIANKHHSFLGGIGNVNLHNTTYFLQVQRYSKFKVVYCPSMSVHHEHVGTPEYKKFRFRTSDAKEFSDFFKLKAMYEVNKIAYDFTKSDKKEVGKSTEKDSSLGYILNANCLECLELLNSKNITPVLLKRTCLAFIKKEEFIDLYLGYTSEEDLQEGKKLFNEGELWVGKTKDVQIGHVSFKLPYPVVTYLNNLYGQGCIDAG